MMKCLAFLSLLVAIPVLAWAYSIGGASLGVGQTDLSTLVLVNIPAAGCNNATASTSFDLPTSNAAGVTCIGTNPTTGVLTFPNNATVSATTHFDLPQDWTTLGGVDIRLYYSDDTSSTNTIDWSVATRCVADGVTLTGTTWNTASSISSAGPATSGWRKGQLFQTVNISSTTNCLIGNTMFIKVERNGTSDANAGIAWLMSVEVAIRVRR